MKVSGQTGGFSLVEVIIASAISAVVMAAMTSILMLVGREMAGEGSVTDPSTQLPVPLAPSAPAMINALNLCTDVRTTVQAASWTMATDLPLNLLESPSSARISGLAAAAPSDLSSPAAFRQFLASAGFSFRTTTGFTVLFFSTQDEVLGYLTVEHEDVAGHRHYRCHVSRGFSASSFMEYTFAEEVSRVQSTPTIRSLLKEGKLAAFYLELPDPSSRYARNMARLERSIQDPVVLAEASGLLSRDTGLRMVIPVSP